jgi:hypothetical protein
MDYRIYCASNAAISRSFPGDTRDGDSSLFEEIKRPSFGEFPIFPLEQVLPRKQESECGEPVRYRHFEALDEYVVDFILMHAQERGDGQSVEPAC